MDIWDYVIWYGSAFSPIIPLLLVRKWKEKYLIAISIFILLSFSADIIGGFIIDGNNYNFLHVYGLLECIILFGFYRTVLNKGKNLIIAVGLAFIIFYVYDSFWVEVNQFNTIGRSVESFIMIVLSLSLFFQFFRREDDIFLEKSPLFWINIGILIYFSGALFSFVMSSVILTTKLSWVFHNVSNILKNVFIAIGLWKAKLS